MITLDASVVVAHLTPLDPHHATATAYLREQVDAQLVIHPLNLAEAAHGRGLDVGPVSEESPQDDQSPQ